MTLAFTEAGITVEALVRRNCADGTTTRLAWAWPGGPDARAEVHVKPALVLLVPGSERERLLADLRALGLTDRPDPFFDLLELGAHSYGFVLSGRVIEDFEPEELEEVTRVAPDPYAVLVEYENVESAKALLGRLIRDRTGVVDTNYGELIEFSEFVDRMEAEPDWDWRL